MVIPSQQSEKPSQLQTTLEAGRADALPVADHLELRRLVDALCHASKVTGKPLDEMSRVDADIVLYPDRYMDEDGQNMWDQIMRLLEQTEGYPTRFSRDTCARSAEPYLYP